MLLSMHDYTDNARFTKRALWCAFWWVRGSWLGSGVL